MPCCDDPCCECQTPVCITCGDDLFGFENGPECQGCLEAHLDDGDDMQTEIQDESA